MLSRALGSVQTRLQLPFGGMLGGGGGGADPRLRAAERDVASSEARVATLASMARELALELVELNAVRARLAWSRTLLGRASNGLGYVLSVYGGYRMVMCCVNIAFKRDPSKDPVTVGMELALRYAHVREPQLWVQPISLAFVGVLVFTSVRGFLISFANLFVAWSASSAVSTNSVVILLASVMGTYFIASVLLLRMAMPEQYRCGRGGRLGGRADSSGMSVPVVAVHALGPLMTPPPAFLHRPPAASASRAPSAATCSSPSSTAGSTPSSCCRRWRRSCCLWQSTPRAARARRACRPRSAPRQP